MRINQNTKISKILKHHPAALDALISLSPRFKKLRNPPLRKLMASRTSITMASKVGGCDIEDFYHVLQPLGFTIQSTKNNEPVDTQTLKPEFLKTISPDQVKMLDVRPILDKGEDPFRMIMDNISKLQPGEVFKIINSFEPTPLIEHLHKKGFEVCTDQISEEVVETWFYRNDNTEIESQETDIHKLKTEDWAEAMEQYKNRMEEIDVRGLEAPMPMMNILEALEALSEDKALFVFHKRIPLFLLPELQQKQFDYRINEVSEDEVQVIIFKSL
ncbi:MAG: DUF2249 domain-containing protein [Bacteroidetes bacterium]|jgi:uncharacterized protein (DUF2249 family)|nr:DUF2249 domain-containing protein [Bacteroidota bacterium]